jgi:phage baseplate assembly protein W
MSTRNLKGTSFPFRRGLKGFPQPVSGPQTVLADVQGLLTTQRGEVPMKPNLGVSMYRYVHETSGPLLQARVVQELRTTLDREEPRMLVLAITTQESNIGDGRHVDAIIDYEIAGEQGRMTVPIEGNSGG